MSEGINIKGQCQGCAKLPAELRGIRKVVSCKEQDLVMCCKDWECKKCLGNEGYCTNWVDDPKLSISLLVYRHGASLRRYGKLIDLNAPSQILDNEIKLFMRRKSELLERREETLRHMKGWLTTKPEGFDRATDGEIMVNLDWLIVKISKTIEPNMESGDEEEEP